MIEHSPRKKNIVKITIDKLSLPANAEIVFHLSNIKTIGDILQLSEIDILKIKGVGRIRYREILTAILMVATSIEEQIVNVENSPQPDPLDNRLYNQPE